MKLRTCSVTGESLSDAIARAVRARTNGRIRGLRVEVDDDCVIPSGRTSTYYAKQLATHAVLDVYDQFRLTNNIDVD